MKKIFFTSLIMLVSTVAFSQHNAPAVKHLIYAVVYPNHAKLSVTDTLRMKDAPEVLYFHLNNRFQITAFSKNIIVQKVSSSDSTNDVGMDRDEPSGGIKTDRWKVTFKNHPGIFSIHYDGTVDSVLQQNRADYQRGFTESTGIISRKGVYLAGSTYWVPTFKDRLSVFELTSQLPTKWKSVSQGKRTLTKTTSKTHIDRWVCDKPQEEIFLIAAPFTEYGYTMNNGVQAMAFLRTPDEGLSSKYLEATEQYMEMYEGLIAKYPYSKFALVENFWETGYGMPSFTLLGEKIIRFPFILYSSYPHELLHNWWGNSAYVDFSKGNWCEGITAYMADHMMKEQNGRGEAYRRSTLQKFTDFVNPGNDFPLTKFASRYNASSEAIGYGKALMMWHMVRRKLGDEMFKKGLRLFYENHKFKVASYDDIRQALEQVSGMDLKPFFHQWLTRTGAPELSLKSVSTDRYNSQYRLFITLQQVQPQKAFVLDIPIGIATAKGTKFVVEHMTRKEQLFEITLDEKPLKLAVDPQYDVFRRLNVNEVPPSMSKALASKINVFVLPSSATKAQIALYRQFAEQWKASDNDQFSILLDKDLKVLPKDKTAWILGYKNRFVPFVNKQLKPYNSSLGIDSITLEGKPIAKSGKDFILNLRDEKDENRNSVFIAIDNQKAIAGLVRKLPHYGKYGYLGFEGDEPVNMAKGQWPVLHSPLIKIFDKSGQHLVIKQKRKPLAEKKTLFSQQRMMETIKYLSSDALKGRGLGTPELDEAADYIAHQFKADGLKPLGSSYFQEFKSIFRNKGTLHLKNVVAYIPGTDEKLKDSPVVVSAHYDHLGLGWPDVHKGDEGKVHHGADDNASGVSILLELAKTMGTTLHPKRPILFVAFTGEEAGLIGSRYFVNKIHDFFKGAVMADVNLDTDGRLFDGTLLVLNANSAKEWKFIFMGTDYTTGVKSSVVLKQLDSSDQLAFIEKGIPGVQLFTGATADYHRPTDTWDKIDPKGLVKVATVTKEVLEYLADREEPLEYTGTAQHAAPVRAKPKKARRVATGSIPDFAYTGEGVKIGSVIPGSTGEKAGLQKGDLIIALNGKKVNDLKGYSNLLKQYQPGDKVVLTIQRKGHEKKISLKLGER